MNIPLPPAAFPVGMKAGASAGFVTAVLIGLALYMAAKNKASAAIPSTAKTL